MEITALEERSDLLEVEYASQHANVVFGRRNDLHFKGMVIHGKIETLPALIDVDIGQIGHSQLLDSLFVTPLHPRQTSDSL